MCSTLKFHGWKNKGDAHKLYPDFRKKEESALVLQTLSKLVSNEKSSNDEKTHFQSWIDVLTSKGLNIKNHEPTISTEDWVGSKFIKDSHDYIVEGLYSDNNVILFQKEKDDNNFELNYHTYDSGYYPDGRMDERLRLSRPGAISWNGIIKLLTGSKPVILYEPDHYFVAEITANIETPTDLCLTEIENVTKKGRHVLGGEFELPPSIPDLPTHLVQLLKEKAKSPDIITPENRRFTIVLDHDKGKLQFIKINLTSTLTILLTLTVILSHRL